MSERQDFCLSPLEEFKNSNQNSHDMKFKVKNLDVFKYFMHERIHFGLARAMSLALRPAKLPQYYSL